MTYDEALAKVRRIVGEGDDVQSRVVRLPQSGFDHYSWLGI